MPGGRIPPGQAWFLPQGGLWVAPAMIRGSIKERWVRARAEAGDGDRTSPGGSSLVTSAGSRPQGKVWRGPCASWQRGCGGLSRGQGGTKVRILP